MYPNYIKKIINIFYKNNFKAYVVGGAVRDYLLNITPKDYDLCTNARPNQIINLFSSQYKLITSFKKYGTITIIDNNNFIEVTTFRTEKKYKNNRKPSKVLFTKNLKSDLSRRDFTINAIAYNHIEGIIDPFDGYSDLKNKIITTIKSPEKIISQDALRILRAIRFSLKYNLVIEKKTKEAINNNMKLLNKLSHERITEEIIKMIKLSDFYKSLRKLKDFQIFNYLKISNKTKNISKNINKIPNTKIFRLLSLIEVFNINDIYFFKLEKKDYKKIKINLSYLDKKINTFNKYKIKILTKNIGKNQIYNFLKTYEILNNITIKEEIKNIIKNIIEKNLAIKKTDLDIDGNDLINIGIKPGKQIGVILQKIYYEVLNENLNNKKKDILKFINKINK
ncbi:MAG: CCA tRNA nucleotidyltransferase [Bacillota bacterium]